MRDETGNSATTDEYKKYIIQSISAMSKNDTRFLIQLTTLIQRHNKRKGEY